MREAGSYKAFFARSWREVLTLRALALKDRAETSDVILSFVFIRIRPLCFWI